MLKSWLKTILALTVILGIAELLLPAGDVGKFARLVLGLTIMLAVLQPLSDLLQPSIVLPTFLPEAIAWHEQNFEPRAESLLWAGMRPLLSGKENTLINELEELILANTSLEEVSVELENGIFTERLKVYIKPKTRDLEEVVRVIIMEYLPFESKNILISAKDG